jgi:hypothetical protein
MAQDMPVETKKRGWAGALLLVVLVLMGCSTSWRAYVLVTSLLGVPLNPGLPPESAVPIEQYFGASVPSWYPITVAIINVLLLIFIVAIWRWKKWGVFGLYGAWLVAVATQVLALGSSALLPALLRTLIPLALLGFLIQRTWHSFE